MSFTNTAKVLILTWIILPCSVFAVAKPLVPNEIIQSFLESYSPVEKKGIESDYKNIRNLCFSQAKDRQQELIYVATAGAPGSGKTTILETYLHSRPGFVYVDPDQRALKFMINTYLQQTNSYAISQATSYRDLMRDMYSKWRGASNYISNSILNEAYAKKFAIAHGTTSTNEAVSSLYKKLKENKYKIILLLCASPEESRIKAKENRETKQGYVQSTQKDLVQKELMFYENFPIYFKFADEIQLFWMEDFSKGGIKIGDYSRTNGLKKMHKDLEKFKNAYESFRNEHVSKQLPSFDDLLSQES